MPEIKLPNSDQIQQIINVLNEDKMIFGVYWDRTSNPTMVRTDSAVGLQANIGKDGELVANDFDNMPIYRDMGEVVDDYGNHFTRIPKVYIQRVVGKDFKITRISKTRYPGFYLPWIFWDFTNNQELDYYDHGKSKGNLSDDGLRLESKPDKHPLVEKNIVDFRNLAQANNDEVNGLLGYQQLDIHAQDVLTALFEVEFATLNSQSVAEGFTTGQYSSGHTATIAETGVNRIVVANSTASGFRIGQSIGIGVNHYSNSVSVTPRLITDIYEYDTDNTAIEFDGDPIDITIGDVVANRGWINGFSRDIASSSGYIEANDGKHPFSYRGIESPFGDIWQFVDGININEHQTWIAKNADEYASNVFASPYEKIGYVNSISNGYISQMGFDANYPFAQFPVEVNGSSSTYYADYYWQTTGQRIALVGGSWASGASAGLSYWILSYSSGTANVILGGRLLRKPLL